MHNLVGNDGMDVSAGIITSHLVPGEHILWVGQPKQGFALRGWDVVYVPFSLFMVIAGSTITVVELRRLSDPGLLLFVIFWTIGAYWLAFGRFFYDARKRACTYYALTNARVIAISGNSSYDVRAIQLNKLKEVTFTKRSDGTGTLEFDRPGFFSFRTRFDLERGMDVPWLSMDPLRSMAFEMITDAREVYNLILQTREAALADEKQTTSITPKTTG